MALETTITNGIIKYLNGLHGCLAEKIMGNAFQKDKPDINGCWRGQMFKIEVKSPDHGNTPSEGQKYELKKWRRAGCVCFVAYSVADVKERITNNFCREKENEEY